MLGIHRSPSTVSDPEIATRTLLLPPVFHIQYDQPTNPTGTTEFLCAGAVTYWWPSPSVTQCRNPTSWWSLPLPITTADQRKVLCSNDEDGRMNDEVRSWCWCLLRNLPAECPFQSRSQHFTRLHFGLLIWLTIDGVCTTNWLLLEFSDIIIPAMLAKRDSRSS